MEECYYKCKNIVDDNIIDVNDENISNNVDTYTTNNSIINLNNIKFIILELFKEKYFYTKLDIIKRINFFKRIYTLEQIELALNELMKEPNIITDRYDRKGKLENIGELYIFSPLEIKNDNLNIYDRINPILNKNEDIELTYSLVDNETQESNKDNDDYNIFIKNIQNFKSKIIQTMEKVIKENETLKDIYNIDLFDNIIIKMFYEKLSIKEKINVINSKAR